MFVLSLLSRRCYFGFVAPLAALTAVSSVGSPTNIGFLEPTNLPSIVKDSDCILVASVDHLDRTANVAAPAAATRTQGTGDVTAVLIPIRVLKGKTPRAIRLRAGTGMSEPRFPLLPGHQYLFFLRHEGASSDTYVDSADGRADMPLLKSDGGEKIRVDVFAVQIPKTNDPKLFVGPREYEHDFPMEPFVSLVATLVRDIEQFSHIASIRFDKVALLRVIRLLDSSKVHCLLIPEMPTVEVYVAPHDSRNARSLLIRDRRAYRDRMAIY